MNPTATNVISNYTTDAAFAAYRPIAINTLKTTTQKALEKWWTTKLGNLNLQYKPGISIETLGEDFLIEAGIFWKGVSYDEFMTLGEILETREYESDDASLQFEVNASRVESAILMDKDYGIIKSNWPLMQLIEMIQIPQSEQFIIGGGRHRSVALATLAQVISGWEAFRVPVKVLTPRTSKELVSYVTTSNGSRSMTATEKAILSGAAQGLNLSILRSPEELFADAREQSKTVTDLKMFNRSTWPALLSGTSVDGAVSVNGQGDIGNAFLSNFARLMNAMEKKSANVLLAESTDGTQLFESLVRRAAQWTQENWDKISQEPEFLDYKADGSADFNPSRKASKIGKWIATMIFEASKEKLQERWQAVVAEETASKQAKAAKKLANSTKKELASIESTYEMLKSTGITDKSVYAKLDERKAALQEQLKQEEAQTRVEQAAQAQAQAATPAAPSVNQPPSPVTPVSADPSALFR